MFHPFEQVLYLDENLVYTTEENQAYVLVGIVNLTDKTYVAEVYTYPDMDFLYACPACKNPRKAYLKAVEKLAECLLLC